jgi:hypothetical protein
LLFLNFLGYKYAGTPHVGQYNRAFGKQEDETLTNNDIIIYLRGVFERHIKSEGAK